MSDGDKNTHFGFQTVDTGEKAGLVRGVFDSVASKYDLMNDLMSFGVHRLWKRAAIALSGVRARQRVLDLASGTGDLADRFSELVGPDGLVLMTDINAAMLNVGRDRMIDRGHVGNLAYAQVNAESLPFPEDTFDLITIAFGLRNVTDKQGALGAMYRALKPGGRALILEFSKPLNRPLEKLYDLYSFQVLPRMGQLVAKDAESYRYLAESIRVHPDQETLRGMMEQAGFERCDVHNLTGGIVAVHRGFKF
jgi:demethylmenaquinone methyltransferase/2-methoxy-6-polyprenyl-1,4-benzoquinol methylase